MHRPLSWMIAPLRNAVVTSAKGYELYTTLRIVSPVFLLLWILFSFRIMETIGEFIKDAYYSDGKLQLACKTGK
jgi:hypothetical protein